MRRLALACLALAIALQPGTAAAQVGVGVTVGRIRVDQPLSPGGSYNLPAIGVINTGGQASDYSVRITYMADQPELRPPQDWFSFRPEVFHLEPDQSHTVGIRLTVPTTARPGDYFALVEAFPIVAERPGVVIGVAAATKLNFTVRHSNQFMATALWVYHRVDDTAPYSYLVAGLLGLGLLIYWGRRIIRLQVRIERRR